MEELVKLARKTIEEFFRTGKIEIKSSDKFQKPRGVFVTIYSYPEHELRGCVGFIEPEYPLYEAVQRAAIESAFHDRRFEPLEREELKEVVFEVSILTYPELIQVKNPKEYLKKIVPRKDGLIIEYGVRRALLLPQVWEQIKDKKEFLETLCWKAGLTPDMWLDKGVKIYKFKVQAFMEKSPEGEIVRFC